MRSSNWLPCLYCWEYVHTIELPRLRAAKIPIIVPFGIGFLGGIVWGPEVPWKKSSKPYQVLPWWTPHAVCPSTVDWDLNFVCASDRLGCWETLGFIPNQIDGVIENENPWFTAKIFPNQSIVPPMWVLGYGQVIDYLHNSMVSTTKQADVVNPMPWTYHLGMVDAIHLWSYIGEGL